MKSRIYLVLATAFALLAIALAADAATITVSPGQSIQAAINSAAAGDTVSVSPGDYTGGITINKAITVVGVPNNTKLHATTPGTGTGVTIASDNCTLQGFYIDSFQIAIAYQYPGSTSGFKNGVTIKNNHTYYSQFHCWIGGNNWLVEGNDFERVRWWDGQGDADYTRMFGTGHVFRGNYLHGTNFSNTDLAPASGSDYAHTDGIQYYGSNGEVLKNCTIEGNYFTDFHQGLFLCDEGVGSLSGLIIRNNVFWGQSYTPSPGSANFNGMPSWGICIGKNVGGTGMIVQNNLIYNVANHYGIRAASSGNWSKNINVNKNNGTLYDTSTTTPSAVTVDNIYYSISWTGQGGYNGADRNLNPMLTNVSLPLGVDGISMTNDDGWKPTALAALLYGPQLASTPPPNTPPTVFAGADQTIQLVQGATAAIVTLSGAGADAEGTVEFTWTLLGTPIGYSTGLSIVQNVGTSTYRLTATDTGGLTTSDTVDVTVLAYVAPVDPLEARIKVLEDQVKDLQTRMVPVETSVKRFNSFPLTIGVKSTSGGTKQVPAR